MITKLVTVTCKRDFTSMLRQAESVQKFLAPCEHLVIIEDRGHSKSFWIDQLSKYYTNHKLIVKGPDDFGGVVSEHYMGWARQQAFKLLASLDCNDKYLVIDSKDFFIKPTQLSDWDDYMGSNCLVDTSTMYNPFYLRMTSTYSLYFNEDIIENIFEPTTPFVFDTKYFTKKELMYDVKKFLSLTDCWSEFIYYSYLAQDLIRNFKQHKYNVENYKLKTNLTTEIIATKPKIAANDQNSIIFGIHRDAISRFTEEETALVNNWIRSLGLSVTL